MTLIGYKVHVFQQPLTGEGYEGIATIDSFDGPIDSAQLLKGRAEDTFRAYVDFGGGDPIVERTLTVGDIITA